MAEILFFAAGIITLLSLTLMAVRFIIGPRVADRGVALDGMTIVGISVIIFIAQYTARTIYVDVALIYGLISFLGIVALARYIEGGL